MMASNMVMRLMVLYLATVMTTAAFPDSSPQAADRWYRRFRNLEATLSKFTYYFHEEDGSGEVAQASITDSIFGFVKAFGHYRLTATRDPSSETVGYGEGIYTGAAEGNESQLVTFNFYFTAGEYSGSYLSLQGHKTLHEYGEIPIAGGSGIFRMAQGSVVTRSNLATETPKILEITFYVVYYQVVKGESL